jgi:hypothetical protein
MSVGIVAGVDHSLQIFESIPARHGVIAVSDGGVLLRRGECAVYDELDLHLNELVDGGLYVIEYQSPRHSMPIAMFATLPGARMKIDRKVVRIARHSRLRDMWVVHPLRPCPHARTFVCTDGPYEDFQLADKLIGRVVGILRPH